VIPERPGRTGPDPLEPLFSAVAVAQDWFTRQLLESPEARVARDYLAGREVPLETAALHGLGYAPGGRVFLDAMAQLGVKEQVLLEAGLTAARDDGSVVPRFRARLLFPIHDLRPGGGWRPTAAARRAKYLNSPARSSTAEAAHNLHQARGQSARRSPSSSSKATDVLRLVLAGWTTCGALGTALTLRPGDAAAGAPMRDHAALQRRPAVRLPSGRAAAGCDGVRVRVSPCRRCDDPTRW
jgi:hypothetical protein